MVRQSSKKLHRGMSFVQTSLTEMIERADVLYAKRSELENVRLTIELLQYVAPDTYDAAWRLGRARFFLGQEAKSDSEARRHYAQGIRVCARAVKLRPESVEGHFWLGVNLALTAGLEKHFRAFSYAFRATRALRHAVRIDPAYHGAGPFRVLARVQHNLPRWLGGGSWRARSNFERAVELAPTNTVTRIYFAELLLEMGDEPEARKQLETIVNIKPDPIWAFEISRDQQLAQEKLTAMDEVRNK